MTITNRILLHLSLIEHVGSHVIARILEVISLDHIAQLYEWSANDFHAQCGISLVTAQKIVEGLASTDLLEQELTLLDLHPISCVTLADTNYPVLLRTIHLPPTILYWQGSAILDERQIAVIGSRDANDYAKQAIDTLVPELVAHGWTITSGGARGADAMAHEAALKAGGKTIAVLGAGLLVPQLVSNRRLFEAMLAQGSALVSIFPLKMHAAPAHFPIRNRIISGLSQGCVVAQAALESGARITANFALSQGKEVFAIPGPIYDPLSAGCHALIQQGAKLTTNITDILQEFGQEVIPADTQVKIAFTSEIEPVQTSIEGTIARLCRTPCTLDELIEHTNIPLITLTPLLFDLQIQGKIIQNGSGLWESRAIGL